MIFKTNIGIKLNSSVVVNSSAWTKRISGVIITAVGAWFIWQAF